MLSWGQSPKAIGLVLIRRGLGEGASLVAQAVKNLPAMQETWAQSLGWEDPLEKGMATHSGIFAWRIERAEEPSWPQSMESQRVQHDWVINIVFYKKRMRYQKSLWLSDLHPPSLYRRAMWRHSGKVICKPGKEASPETNPDGTLILDLVPSTTVRK